MARTIRNLNVVNQATNKTTAIQSIAGDVTAGELLTAYARQIGLPDNARGKLVRKRTQKELQGHETLEGAGLEDSETLIAYMEMIPGR